MCDYTQWLDLPIISFVWYFHWTIAHTAFFSLAHDPTRARPPECSGFYITHRHTTLGRAPLDEDRPVAETSTWHHTTLTTDRHPCPRWDSNLQPQLASGRRPTPRPLGHWDRHPSEWLNTDCWRIKLCLSIKVFKNTSRLWHFRT
jgi:hypothetical protein